MNSAGDTRRFREAIGHFATGVCVVTAFSDNGPTGMTANAITSLSLDPLLMVVCFDRSSRTRVAAQASGKVAVNVLSSEQEGMSHIFASKASEAEKFAEVAWSERAEVPVIDGSLAWFAGRLTEIHSGGDHEIGVVAVDQFDADGGEPLIFHRGSYARLG